MARLPASRLSSASCSRSSREVIKRGAAVELIDDVEDRLLPLLGRRVRREQPADPEVRLGAQLLRDQRIGGFLNAVVDEPVGAVEALDQFLADGLPQSRVDLLLRSPEDDRQASRSRRCCRGRPAAATPFCVSAGRRVELADHQVHDIVGVALGVDAVEIPGPARRIMIEGEQPFLGERGQELDGEERIAAGLLVHQLRERRGALRLAAKRVRDQLPEMLPGERRQRDLRDLAAGGLDGVELAHQRMGGGDLVVAIGADQHQVLQIRLASADPPADRASPRRAIADRRGTAPADVPAGRRRR